MKNDKKGLRGLEDFKKDFLSGMPEVLKKDFTDEKIESEYFEHLSKINRKKYKSPPLMIVIFKKILAIIVTIIVLTLLFSLIDYLF